MGGEITLVVNLEAEQALLGCLITNPDAIRSCQTKKEFFGVEKHREIFDAILRLETKSSPIDLVTVTSELGDRLPQLGGVSYLSKMAEYAISNVHLENYEGLVWKAFRFRKAKEILNKFNTSGSPDTFELLIDEMSSLTGMGYSKQSFDLKQELISICEETENDTGLLSGVGTGINEIDLMTGGLQKGELIVIGARPSMGKTAFMLNLANAACNQNVVVTIFSLEMGAAHLLKRIISMVGNLEGGKWKNPYRYFASSDYERLSTATSIIEKYTLFIHDRPGQSVQDIRKEIAQVKLDYADADHLVLIDYLTLIKQSGRSDNQTLAIAEISRALKETAREFNLPIVLLSQLNRSVEFRADKRPMMSDLRDSGAIEQDADIIAFLYRDDYYSGQSTGHSVTELNIAKHRNGPTGVIEMLFDKNTSCFLDLGDRTNGK